MDVQYSHPASAGSFSVHLSSAAAPREPAIRPGGGRSISHAIHQDMDASGVNVSSWKFNLFPRSVGFRGLIFIGCSSLCWVLGEMD